MSYLIKCNNCEKTKVLNEPQRFAAKDVNFKCEGCGEMIKHKVTIKSNNDTVIVGLNDLKGKIGSLNLLGPTKNILQNYILSEGTVKIGRSYEDSEADIQLPGSDRTLSRCHCIIKGHYSIKRETMEYLIYDDQSTNGVYINNVEITKEAEVYLHHGDIIQLGKTILKFEMV